MPILFLFTQTQYPLQRPEKVPFFWWWEELFDRGKAEQGVSSLRYVCNSAAFDIYGNSKAEEIAKLLSVYFSKNVDSLYTGTNKNRPFLFFDFSMKP